MDIEIPANRNFRLAGSCFLAVLCSDQGLSQLIGAGGGLHATLHALDSCDDIVNVHALNQSSDALQVAVAAADELNVLDLAIFHIKQDALGAGTLSLLLKHNDSPLNKYYTVRSASVASTSSANASGGNRT